MGKGEERHIIDARRRFSDTIHREEVNKTQFQTIAKRRRKGKR